MLRKVNMPPQTRRIAMEENRSLRSNKIQLIRTVQISLARCDKKKTPSPRKPVKKNTVRTNENRSTPSKNPKSNKRNRYLPVATTSKKPTKLEEKFFDKKCITTLNSIRNRRLSSKQNTNLPESVIKGGRSPKKVGSLADLKSPKKTAALASEKPATLTNIRSPKKPTMENDKSSPIKQTATKVTKETSKKSEIRIGKPLLKKNLGKGNRLKKHMKLGRIYINPTFPLRSVLKRHLHSDNKEENQGRFVTVNNTSQVLEQNNNNIGTCIQPKIVLRKIDEAEKPIRKMRRILRQL